MVRITLVEKNSLAHKAGVKDGDYLAFINDNEINDVLDYRFYLTEKKVLLSLVNESGKEYEALIKKSEYDDIGLSFETPLMDKKQTCKNGCIFCFIDQNPKGLREPLYFKDDDSRLSFIHGNYITLTNMTDKDVDRIIKMRFSPINISIHTTNPELRVSMMKNKRSGQVLSYLGRIKEAGLSMCGQIVLCKGVNDGAELERSMSDLSGYFPELSSVSVVPAGLTKFREGLYPLTDFSAAEAGAIIDMIDAFEDKHLSLRGSRMFFAADEFYLKAGRPIPQSEYYEQYPQIENGVGMLRSFAEEFDMAVEDLADVRDEEIQPRCVSVATGVAAYPFILGYAEKLTGMFPKLKIKVYKIVNSFFGESITVSGLLTGIDMYNQLKNEDLGEELFVPESCLRREEDDFLCGMTRAELQDKLGVMVSACENDGYEFVRNILGAE